jgi:hypothetical protein
MAVQLDELAGPDGGDESRRLAKFWLDQINYVKDNSQHKHWVKRGETIVKRYRDERNRTDEEGQRRYNALWSNIEILKPALYGKTPLPIAERRFKDPDPAGRTAAQILERALRNEIEICGFHDALNAAVTDYLLPGRGTVWVRYEPEIEEGVSLPPESQTDMRDTQGELPGRHTPPTEQETQTTTPGGRTRPRLINHEEVKQEVDDDQPEEQTPEEEKLEATGDRVIRESTPVDFVEWCDFFTFPVRARNWTEVTGIGKRVYMSRDQMKRRFGSVVGKGIPLEKDTRGDRVQNTMLQSADEDKGQVYEIWSKTDKCLYWVAMGYDHLCDRKEDPLQLEFFYPTPRPLYANPSNNTLIPVPDFIQYQDQAIQVDELTQRIAMLTKACKMCGVYNAAAKDIQRLFNESIENELIPVDDWAAFAEKGGVEGNWSLMPVQVIKDVINELMMVKQKQIEEMDRLTGINDILRGTSDARETLGGVRLKSNNTGTRLTHRQNEVARFARDTVRIMADIMAQHFSPQSLIEASGALYEEGLCKDDMPSLSALNQPPAAPGQGPLTPPSQAPATSMGQSAPGGARSPSSAAPPGVIPGPPPGSNVVPLRPQMPGAPPPGGQGMPGMPPGGPQMAPGAGMPPPMDPELQRKLCALQAISKAIDLIRDERLRGFRVDIEVDSTIFADAAQEKQDRTEFMTSVTGFLVQALPLGAQLPPLVPLLGKLLTFGVRGYRVGRDLEMAIEEFAEKAEAFAQEAAQKAASQPDPIQAKMQIEGKKADAQIQAIQMKTQGEGIAAKAELENQQMENQNTQQENQADMASKQMDLKMKEMEMQIQELKGQVEKFKAHHEMQMAMMPPPPPSAAAPAHQVPGKSA